MQGFVPKTLTLSFEDYMAIMAEDRHMTMVQLAKAAGVSPPTWKKYRQQPGFMPIYSLEAVCMALSLSEEETAEVYRAARRGARA